MAEGAVPRLVFKIPGARDVTNPCHLSYKTEKVLPPAEKKTPRAVSTQRCPEGPYPLIEQVGECGCIRVQAPFSLKELSQIKKNLGKFSGNPDNYIEAFQSLYQMFDLSYRDLMLLLEQTLSHTEKEKVLAEARDFGNNYYISCVRDIENPEKEERYLTRSQAVSSADPGWDPDVEMWKIRHCQACVIEGLRRSKSKPINYSRLTTISQEANGNPSAFLERLREALVKYTNVTPDSLEGQLILKDKFIIQSAPDVRRKLQKLSIGAP
ncbi:uncharacterized protein LOC129151054 [Eptesicus fuscus]|uniref:uncharacterized protein LOC129151054 n=1 Tax=Eptesicus fuscus TaxID=29078 RepID=UPI00240431EC|nr:uncharacterized protein LOC129151054 [Eptesicus fuscus]